LLFLPELVLEVAGVSSVNSTSEFASSRVLLAVLLTVLLLELASSSLLASSSDAPSRVYFTVPHRV